MYDKVCRDFLWKASERKGVQLASFGEIKDMYKGATIGVRIMGGWIYLSFPNNCRYAPRVNFELVSFYLSSIRVYQTYPICVYDRRLCLWIFIRDGKLIFTVWINLWWYFVTYLFQIFRTTGGNFYIMCSIVVLLFLLTCNMCMKWFYYHKQKQTSIKIRILCTPFQGVYDWFSRKAWGNMPTWFFTEFCIFDVDPFTIMSSEVQASWNSWIYKDISPIVFLGQSSTESCIWHHIRLFSLPFRLCFK